MRVPGGQQQRAGAAESFGGQQHVLETELLQHAFEVVDLALVRALRAWMNAQDANARSQRGRDFLDDGGGVYGVRQVDEGSS